MLIKDFFDNFSKKRDEVIKNFGEYIKEESIETSNNDCPYIKKLVENVYNHAKVNEIKRQKSGNLREFNVTK
ncbi:MAG TPA: hypothetical protein EYP16_07035 [Candidatus Atribacteria bacterium]|nr:hypothetical protein [Candidatus Atribacteria bacterium]